jgi:acyl dehydratase
MTTATRGLDAVEIGQTVRVSKTIGETDVYLFAGITGDFSPNHVNEEYMKATRYGQRIAHGVLAMGFMSTASSKLLESVPFPAVSYGYDRVRFVRPLLIGDTLTVEYKIIEKVPDKDQTLAQVTATNQRGEVVAVATHILKFV